MSIPLALPSTQKLGVTYTASWEVVIPMPVYSELMHYVQMFPGECSGCTLVEHSVKGAKHTFTLGRVFLPLQTNTGASTDITEEEVARLQTQMVRDGLPTEKLRCHWHSHAGMDVFHSGTDKDNYDVLKTGEYLVSLVLNKAGAIKASIHYYKPFTFQAENINVVVMLDNVEHNPEWDAAVARVTEYEATKRTKYAPPVAWQRDDRGYDEGGYGGYGGYHGTDTRFEKRLQMATMAKELLMQFCPTFDFMPLRTPTILWDEAKVECGDLETGRVYSFKLCVEDVREILPIDQTLMEDFNGTEETHGQV